MNPAGDVQRTEPPSKHFANWLTIYSFGQYYPHFGPPNIVLKGSNDHSTESWRYCSLRFRYFLLPYLNDSPAAYLYFWDPRSEDGVFLCSLCDKTCGGIVEMANIRYHSWTHTCQRYEASFLTSLVSLKPGFSLSVFQVRVKVSNRSSNGVEGQTVGLGRELEENRVVSQSLIVSRETRVEGRMVERVVANLDLGSDVEESKVSWD